MVLRLERVVKRNDERVIARGQDLLLGQGSLDLVPLDHLLLAQNWERVSWQAPPQAGETRYIPFMA